MTSIAEKTGSGTKVFGQYIAKHNGFAAVAEEQQANAEFIVRACNSFDTSLAAMKEARKVLSNLAQSDPTYEPAWRMLTDAIKLAEGKPMRPAASAQPADAEQAKFDAENVADPYDGGRL